VNALAQIILASCFGLAAIIWACSKFPDSKD
jgi:hypothetical protein